MAETRPRAGQPASPGGSRPAAIVVEHVTKSFRLYHERNQSLKATLLSGRRAKFEEFLALDDVSFEVPQGATFGLVGHNGSGKSTMLKCMARILRPDSGRVEVRGRMSALLELGAGFHPELTGRENVYLNGSILGFSKREMDARFDDIVSFSGLERFIDNPVKNYSSGMYVRLGFAVAINADPEVLLVDEVLAVGDEEFQNRCLEKFAALRSTGATVVVVSHGMEVVRRMCDRAAWLEHGKLMTVDTSDAVVEAYLSEVRRQRRADIGMGVYDEADPFAGTAVNSVQLIGTDGESTTTIESGAPVTVRITYRAAEIGQPLRAVVGIYDLNHHWISTVPTPGTVPFVHDPLVEVDYVVPRCNVTAGRYQINVALTDERQDGIYAEVIKALEFEVVAADDRELSGPVDLGGEWATRAVG